MGTAWGACCSSEIKEDARLPVSESESPWSQLHGGELEKALRDGLVKCLDSRYLVELARRNEPLVRRQEMPEEAYIRLDELKEIGVYSRKFLEGGGYKLYQWLPLMIVSYAWLSPGHPDRFGETLSVLADAVEHMEVHGILIDFTALPQVPRNDADNKTFKLGLSCLNRFYSHPHVIVLKVSQFPAGYPRSKPYELPAGFKPVEYSGRGWCFAEAAMAGLGKSPKLVCDVSRLSPGAHVVGGSVVLPRPPLTPTKFDAELREKTFTQPSVDLARVQDLYKNAFTERVRTAKALLYANVKWGPAEIVAFAEAIGENEVAETLDLSLNDVGEAGMQALVEVVGKKALKSLSLARCGLGDGGVIELGKALRGNTTLTTLNVEGNEIGEEGGKCLAEALRDNTKTALTTLSLWGNDVGPEGAKWLAEALRSNSTLTTLDLGNHRIEREGARRLAEALRANTSTALSTLILSGNQIGDEGVRSLAEVQCSNPTLTMMDLKVNRIGAEGARWLAEALRTSAALTSLDLRANRVGAEGTRWLAEALRMSSTSAMSMLDLHGNQIGDEGTRWLAEVLRSKTTLATLDLGKNQIGDEGVRWLAEALGTSMTPTSLNLSNNQIGDEGVRRLGEALGTNAALAELNLGSNRIKNEGARWLAEALHTNTALTTLDLSSNQVGDLGARWLAEGAAISGCKVLN